MTREEIINNLTKTEIEKDGWQIITLEYANEMVKGRYELARWANGFVNGLPFETYRKNFINGLTNVLVEKFIPREELEEDISP